MEDKKQFEGWAVVELYGHQREVGFVSTQYYGAASLFQIDVPELEEREYQLKSPEWAGSQLIQAGSIVRREAVAGRSRLVGVGAIYAINPCTEQTARDLIDRNATRKLQLVSLAESSQLPAEVTLPGEDSDDEDEGEIE